VVVPSAHPAKIEKLLFENLEDKMSRTLSFFIATAVIALIVAYAPQGKGLGDFLSPLLGCVFIAVLAIITAGSFFDEFAKIRRRKMLQKSGKW
jgi:uncharacterized sodium:solute symporter family permease YidK